MNMEPRLDYRKFSAEPLNALLSLEKYIAGCGLDHKFVHVLKLRASQLNGCAFCIDMHSLDARAACPRQHGAIRSEGVQHIGDRDRIP